MIYFFACFYKSIEHKISCVTSLNYALNNSTRTIHSMVTTQTLETKLVIGAYQIITKPLNKAIFKYFRL